MPYDPEIQNQAKKDDPSEKKGLFGVIIHSFFVVPFLLAVFGILLFSAVRILTMEKRSVYDYLEDVKTGGLTKRWQGAFELSRILSNKDAVPNEDKFVAEMIAAFEASKNDSEPRVYQYLALAMARTGNTRFISPILKDITSKKDENLHAIITSLGILKADQAVDVLLKFLNDDNAHIRLATVIALGNIGDQRAIEALQRSLSDSEPNITWDAAIALAKMSDKSGRGIILQLLDRDYLKAFTNVDPEQQTRIMLVAIQASATWKDVQINSVLQKLFESDRNMKVRDLAYKTLQGA